MADEATLNRTIILRRRPGPLIVADDTELVNASIPEIAEGEALVRTELIAMDPVTRIIINEDIGLVPPIELGEPPRSFSAGGVVRSRSPELPVGAKVTGFFQWADWQIAIAGLRTQVLPEG